MPLYEFFSPDTNKIYTFLARTLSMREKLPRCPDGDAYKMERRVSGFSVTGKHKKDQDPSDDPFSHMEESRAEAFMHEMEREMSTMDDQNPDPKQLGRLMRKMADVMGNKTPESLRELVTKLEEGEDPEKLEERYGGMPDAENPDSENYDAAANADLWQTVKRSFSGFRPAKRDPKLYEMSEWV